jgi:putative ABC transport system substrate-binding protein
MKRRKFTSLTAGALLIPGPFCVLAQTNTAVPVIGFVGIANRAGHVADMAGLRQGLEQLGYIIGQTLMIEEYYADGDMAQLNGLLDKALHSKPKLLVVPGLAAALAIRERVPELPVVAVGLPSTVIYPDLFASLHRPGGSVTGFSHFGEDLAAKRVELLKTAVPALTTVAILHNQVDPLYREWGEKTEAAARQQGLQTLRLGLATPAQAELAKLMATAQAAGVEGLIVVRDFLTHTLQKDIVHAASTLRIATMGEQRSFVHAGALMSYGANFPDLFRRAAAYVNKILHGEQPADLPIQLATEFELVVNLRVAKMLNLAIPSSILLRANEVLE